MAIFDHEKNRVRAGRPDMVMSHMDAGGRPVFVPKIEGAAGPKPAYGRGAPSRFMVHCMGCGKWHPRNRVYLPKKKDEPVPPCDHRYGSGNAPVRRKNKGGAAA